jgi:hypothetical protein
MHSTVRRRMDDATKDATIEQLAEYCRSLQQKVNWLTCRQTKIPSGSTYRSAASLAININTKHQTLCSILLCI